MPTWLNNYQAPYSPEQFLLITSIPDCPFLSLKPKARWLDFYLIYIWCITKHKRSGLIESGGKGICMKRFSFPLSAGLPPSTRRGLYMLSFVSVPLSKFAQKFFLLLKPIQVEIGGSQGISCGSLFDLIEFWFETTGHSSIKWKL